MFSGIVASVGHIHRLEALQDGLRLWIQVGSLDLGDVALGDSICCSGVCLTVVARAGQELAFDVSGETLRCTVGLDGPNPVNLEKALRLADRLGGHIVSGHVDGVGTVVRCVPVGESHELVVRVQPSLARYMARKGSIAIDGVSLTINRVEDTADACEVSINLIPHTMAVTTLKRLAAGVEVNIEVDMLARYCERLLSQERSQDK